MSRDPAAIARLCQESGLPPLLSLLQSPSGGPRGHSPVAVAAAIAAAVLAQAAPAQGVDGEVLALMLRTLLWLHSSAGPRPFRSWRLRSSIPP